MFPKLCVVRASRPISGSVADEMFQAAADLYLKENGKVASDTAADLRTRFCEGRVTMHPYVISMGSVTGPAFTAKVEFDSTTAEVLFVIRRVELEYLAEARYGGQWVTDESDDSSERLFN
ncbi:MAG: hypothetical protein Q7R83_01575 [bacterium]|nr:hypothetical protein [bacterium]